MSFFQSIPLDSPVQGDTPTFRFDITVEAGRTITKAWMTAKLNASDPDPGVFQVAITSFGTITDNGDGTTTTECPFRLSSTQSAAIPLSTVNGDVQVLLDNADILTPVIFQVQAHVGYTTAIT